MYIVKSAEINFNHSLMYLPRSLRIWKVCGKIDNEFHVYYITDLSHSPESSKMYETVKLGAVLHEWWQSKDLHLEESLAQEIECIKRSNILTKK